MYTCKKFKKNIFNWYSLNFFVNLCYFSKKNIDILIIVYRIENSNIEIYNKENNEKYQIKYHENCVLSLKYSHFNDWFISTGKDNMINGWKSPYGGHLFSVS